MGTTCTDRCNYPLLFERAGSNPAAVDTFFLFLLVSFLYVRYIPKIFGVSHRGDGRRDLDLLFSVLW